MKNKQNIISKLDNLMTKLTLIRIREILENERTQEYYRDYEHNIAEKIELSKENQTDQYGRINIQTQNLICWNNGFYEFNKTKVLKPTKKRNEE